MVCEAPGADDQHRESRYWCWHIYHAIGGKLAYLGLWVAQCLPGAKYCLGVVGIVVGGQFLKRDPDQIGLQPYGMYDANGAISELAAGVQLSLRDAMRRCQYLRRRQKRLTPA